jgi:hypothetical protein
VRLIIFSIVAVFGYGGHAKTSAWKNSLVVSKTMMLGTGKYSDFQNLRPRRESEDQSGTSIEAEL